jgi:hypothetical protein
MVTSRPPKTWLNAAANACLHEHPGNNHLGETGQLQYTQINWRKLSPSPLHRPCLAIGAQYPCGNQYRFSRRWPAPLSVASRPWRFARLDGGNDSIENIDVVLEHNHAYPAMAPVDFLIKWNPRRQNKDDWLDYAEQHGRWETPRDGKRVALFSVEHKRQ